MEMDLQGIENIGVDIQHSISEQMSALLKDTKCLDIGKAGESLVDLSQTSNKVTHRINTSLARKGILQRVIMSPKRWLARFDNIEKSIDGICDVVDSEIERLDSILSGLINSVDVMRGNLSKLEESNSILKSIIKECEDNPECDPDGFKRQAAISRLKVLTTTSALTKQEISKAILVIQENKEVSNQLKEASSNLIPMFKTMMVNVVATKANEEALMLKKNLIKVADNMILNSAKSIAITAADLSEGRKESLISPATLSAANDVIQAAVERVLDSAKTESEVNLQVIKSLESSASQVKMLCDMEIEKNE